jgi:hypothetical protein
MGIKRNEVAEPQWKSGNNCLEKDNDLFSFSHWKNTINWNLLLEQVKKTETVCQLIDAYLYPSRLFSAYIDILEANLYILDDLFYYQTGIRVGNNLKFSPSELDFEKLKFWNIDCYQKIKMVREGIDRIVIHLMNLSKQIHSLDIPHLVIKKISAVLFFNNSTNPPASDSYDMINQSSYSYAYDAYREPITDEKALQGQFFEILNFLENYRNIFFDFTDLHVGDSHFEILLSSFRQSEKGQNFIKPWKRDFMGSRDSLIVKLEKDPDLGQWVNRYTHRREDKSIIEHLFCDDNGFAKNEEEAYNTDNWIRILTIAAVLQEYDEQEDAVVADVSDEDDTILLKLSPYFKDEATVKRFLNSVRLLNDKEIIALVKKYRDAGLCTDASKGLWKVLHDAKLYKPLYTNWNAQLNKR